MKQRFLCREKLFRMKKRKFVINIFIIVIVLIAILSLVLTKVKNYNETIINLTAEEKMQDFEYLWNVLNDTYPFWYEVEKSGVDKKVVYEEYKKEIQLTNTDIEFMKMVGGFLNDLKGYGHLSVLDGYMYNLYNDTYALGEIKLNNDEIKRMKPWYDVFYNSTSKQTYSLLVLCIIDN
jgi:hypothetical protein